MTTKVISRLKNGIENRWVFLTTLTVASFFLMGQFKHASAALTIILTAILGVTVIYKLFSRFRVPAVSTTSFLQELETGLLFTVVAAIVIQFTGGEKSAFHPINYALAAFLAAYFSASVGISCLLVMIFLEFASMKLATASGDQFAIRSLFIATFAVLGWLALKLEITRLRFNSQKGLESELSRIRQDAEDFRLIGTSVSSTTRTREEAQSLLSRASVENIHGNLYFLVNMLCEAHALNTCAVLWYDEDASTLKVKEASTSSRFFEASAFPALRGPVGYVVKNRTAVNLGDFQRRFGAGAVPYYNGNENVGSLAAVPIMENGQLRGILCADRAASTPFTEGQIALFSSATDQILRILVTERAFHSIEKSKFEQEKFFQASMLMNEALGVDQVVKSAFESVNSIIPVSQMAIITTDDNTCRLTGMRGSVFESLSGLNFSVERSLFALVMENRHHLPINGELRDPKQIVITSTTDFSHMKSVLILPLIVGDRAFGGFILADERPALFNHNRREMLGVIANQVATALQNALMYEKLELMATTDGLTGLTNHRTFQEKFSEMLARATRLGNPLSVILTDIDKFKSVNDTYGHPVGDVVIKRVASILKKRVRNIDLAARYGGEEFAMVLESTDTEGAMALAERIRQEVENEVFESELGEFKASISLGIATYPIEGMHKQQLIEKADKALYYAKQHGRNQAVYFGNT
ncbi:diguanylate cyclase [Myxococcota bacterium]|nr:diguanylate cyclase [Myxococcota bacterium]MBU1380644.1 diguanylate cyclase [Myxococcota bacterium]MBU1496986.1 diguanylate cyclase [Myxococcota bacterium]